MAGREQDDEATIAAFDPTDAGAAAHRFFADLWRQGDPWDLDTSTLDQERYAHQLALLDDRRYGRVLEIGCAAGAFTERLAPLTQSLLAVDIAEPAIRAARQRVPASHITFRQTNVMELEPAEDGPWDLVVLAETIYYLGWLYPMFHVAWLLHALHDASAPGGRLLLVDTISHDNGLMSHWLIHSYRDLARNVGYELERHETLRGTKEGVTFDVSLDLFRRSTG